MSTKMIPGANTAVKSIEGCSLHTYLSHIDELRANYSSSLDFTRYLLDKNMNTESPILTHRKTTSTATTTSPPLRLAPISELHRASSLYSAALDDSKYSSLPMNQDQPRSSLGPESLVGKPLKLFCPLNQMYYTGRIVNWRSCTCYPRPCFFGHDRTASCEYLVRWILPEEEKVIHWWIVLEEHAVAVGLAIIWAAPPSMTNKKSCTKWKPAFLLVRSALEIVPWRKFIIEQGFWGLISFLDRCFLMEDVSNKASYIDLQNDAIDFLSPSFLQARKEEWNKEHQSLTKQPLEDTHLITTTTTTTTSITLPTPMNKRDGLRVRARESECREESTPKNVQQAWTPPITPQQSHGWTIDPDPLHSLAILELEEQRRIFYWHTLPLVRANHPMCMEFMEGERIIPQLEINPGGVGPSMDRLWLTQILTGTTQQEKKPSLDQLASMTIHPVKSIPKAMASLNMTTVNAAPKDK